MVAEADCADGRPRIEVDRTFSREYLFQGAELCSILLAFSTSAGSVLMWGYMSRKTADLSEKQTQMDTSLNWILTELHPATRHQSQTIGDTIFDGLCCQQIGMISPFATYAASLIYLTNKERHYCHKEALMLLVVSSASIICAIVRAKDQFLSSMFMEFLPLAFVLGEVASLVLSRLHSFGKTRGGLRRDNEDNDDNADGDGR